MGMPWPAPLRGPWMMRGSLVRVRCLIAVCRISVSYELGQALPLLSDGLMSIGQAALGCRITGLTPSACCKWVTAERQSHR